MKYSRLTNRYGPGGKAGLVSGIANAHFRISSSVMVLSVYSRPSLCRSKVKTPSGVLDRLSTSG